MTKRIHRSTKHGKRMNKADRERAERKQIRATQQPKVEMYIPERAVEAVPPVLPEGDQ